MPLDLPNMKIKAPHVNLQRNLSALTRKEVYWDHIRCDVGFGWVPGAMQ